MRRVLLTGAGGYIGRHAIKSLLARNFEVHAVSRQPQIEAANVNWHTADLLQRDATAKLVEDVGATHLMHLAWVTEPGAYWQSPENERWLSASQYLLRRFAENGGEKALLCGTCAEYDLTDGDCIEGTTLLKADHPYTEAKLALRDSANLIASQHDIAVAWARVFFSFGPYEQRGRLVSEVIHALRHGNRAACVDGHLLRDFMYVEDVADAMAATLDSGFSGDINIAHGEATTIKGLVDKIAAKLNATGRVDYGVFARKPGDPDRITASTRRLNDDVKWRPRFELDTAIQRTIEWWQEHDPVD